MQPLLRWKKILPFRTMGAVPGPASISGQLRQLLFAAGLLLAFLILAPLGAIKVNRMISTRLVEPRNIPLAPLPPITSAYQTDRRSVVQGTRVTVSVYIGGQSIHTKN